MSSKKTGIKLYNVIFPVWMLLLLPAAWLIVLPGNFIIDSIVLLISMVMLKIEEKKECYKEHIWKIYGFGLLSDIIGSAYMLFMEFVFKGHIGGTLGDELPLTLPALVISAVLIFVFNYYITFKDIDKKLSFKLALIFAVVTAPYTFLIPTRWLW